MSKGRLRFCFDPVPLSGFSLDRHRGASFDPGGEHFRGATHSSRLHDRFGKTGDFPLAFAESLGFGKPGINGGGDAVEDSRRRIH